MLRKLTKSILYKLLNRENHNISKILKDYNSKFNLLDVGAAGGIHNRWHIIDEKINIFCVEPQPDSFNNLKENNNVTLIKKIFDEKDNIERTIHFTKKNDTSSILLPNIEHLKKFPNVGRFEIINTFTSPTSSIDKEFLAIDLDYIKIDVEGYHLNILKGATNKLIKLHGIEVEIEFQPIRKNQPKFYEIIEFLNDFNFELHDILNIIRWERTGYRHVGQPNTSDIVFFKKPEYIIENFTSQLLSEKEVLNYIIILSIYHRSDLLYFLIENLPSSFVKKYKVVRLQKLIESKIKRINFLRKLSTNLDNFMFNYDKI
jgi:FkbM family methyltransferase